MNDPRIAALAEALHKAGIRCSPNIPYCRASHRGHAAAILAALPPDWCGHGQAWNLEDEIKFARLREIEEAARAYREAASNLLGHVDFGRLRKGGDAAQQAWLVADRILRAALEADR